MLVKLPNRLRRDRTGTDPRARDVRPLRLDQHLPEYDAVSRRHVVVDATPETVYEAMMTADLTRLGRVVGALGAIRALPNRLRAWLRGEAEATPESVTFGDIPTQGTWVRLAAVSGEEFVFGAVGTVWRPDIEWVDLSAAEFADFAQPGYAKVAASLSLRPYGRGRTLLSYEARTVGTDEVATRRFRRYWRLVSPFVGYILGRALVRIKRDAEGE